MGYKLGEQMKQSMNWNSYLDARLQFETDVKTAVPERVSNNTDLLRGLHFVMGMVTESYEARNFSDPLNLIEEAGDGTWFSGGLLNLLQGNHDETLLRFVVVRNADYEAEVDWKASNYKLGEYVPEFGLEYAVEILDMYKAAIFYGRVLDPIKLLDLLIRYFHDLVFDFNVCYYVSVPKDDLALCVPSVEAIMAVNIAKLSARYSEGYADAKANNRNKEFEREAMQKALEPYL
jgi:hypothetical protein